VEPGSHHRSRAFKEGAGTEDWGPCP